MDSIERFKKHKKTQERIEHRRGLSLAADQNLVQHYLESEVDFNSIKNSTEKLNRIYERQTNIDVTDKDVNDLLQKMKNDFNQEHFKSLVSACKKDVISAIVIPFGLGRVISKFDKNGGNVTTTRNFEQGVTATPEDTERYSEWTKSNTEFNREPYDYDIKVDKEGCPIKNKNGDFKKTQFNSTKKKDIFKKMEDNSSVIDGYTGKELGLKNKDKIDSHKSIHLEHITSVKEIEISSKNHLFAKGETPEERQSDRVGLARNDNNLTLIEGSVNNSKGCEDLQEWVKKKGDHYDVKPELIEREYKKSKNFLEDESLKRQVKKQGTETAITGATEGVKMGRQQALGIILYEFFDAVFDELHDVYKNGFSTESSGDRFLHIVKERLSRIVNRIVSRWKDAGTSFADGFISGFLSNLVTVVINMFIRTGTRIVRIIREGFFSLMKAMKMICFPPEGMTIAQAAHEASKLIAAGLVVTGGIAIEQYIDTMIKTMPMLEPFADILTSILIGGLTGLATTLIVYAIDKIDFFKVNDDEKHVFIMNKLEASLENLFVEGDVLIAEMAF